MAASLPPGAVLAHVVTAPPTFEPYRKWRTWAKIGDEPWRPVQRVAVQLAMPFAPHPRGDLELTWDLDRCDWAAFLIVTDSVVWEQDYGLRGRHEVMGVVG